MTIEKARNPKYINDIVEIHLNTFNGFFLTFMGRGFLKQMYRSYLEHMDSGILIAFERNQPIGFLAYSKDLSGLYKYMLKKRLFIFAWFSLGAFLRSPKVFMRLLRALLKPSESIRKDRYVELSSIGVDPEFKSRGIGSRLISVLKKIVDFNEFTYIKLETDAIENDLANHFYQKNGFVLEREFVTQEGRRMNEYKFYG